MEFELSKENILPLAGGRNVQQLGMGLQAQTNRGLQLELLQQKEQWETLIKSYTGEDPLDNYYRYISWIEQTYPKHGHEGNLIPLLEHCLSLFENDQRYINERRFCKLWIKYIDLQQNPFELYHMMKAKGLCTGCADFYKAWAYYHEAAGDFQAANKVFEEGKNNCAQPFEDLMHAHQNLIMAAGQHLIYGPDECRLIEKRQALTALHTYKPGKVSSVRVPSSNGVVTVPSNSSSSSSRSNASVYVHEDRPGETAAAVVDAPPISIIAAAKRQEVPKENTLKAGPWTGTVPVKKRVIGSGAGKVAGFLVHEDTEEPQRGLRLPKNYPKTTLEDYTDWHVAVSYPDPPNPAERPMYPKQLVYAELNTEFCIEEIRARRYLKKTSQQPILIDDDEEVEFVQETTSQAQNDSLCRSLKRSPLLKTPLQFKSSPMHVQQHLPSRQYVSPMQPQQPVRHLAVPMQSQQHTPTQHQESPMHAQQHLSQRQHTSPIQQQVAPMQVQHLATLSPMQTQNLATVSPMQTQHLAMVSPMQTQHSPMETQSSPMQDQDSRLFEMASDDVVSWGVPPANFNIWQSPANKAGPSFNIFEQILEQNQPKGSAMKTAFKSLNADELAETGSRGGMDVAVTAQATDSAKRVSLFCDNSSMDDTVNTNAFFSLNTMQASTPQKMVSVSDQNMIPVRDQNMIPVRDQKMIPVRDHKILSIIEEEKSLFGSSSSSGSGTTNQLGMISEEHNSNLAQNLMANAELRSVLGNLIGTTQSGRENQNSTIHSTMLESSMREMPAPATVKPLDFVPSDPFKSQLISQLLERVAFPGPHTFGYTEVQFIPRLCVKKEPICVGRERYVVDKQLGKGTFGTVYKAIDVGCNMTVAMKFQKPANKWEYYICRELQSRLANHPLRDRFMDVPLAYFGDQASLIISTYMPGGSLLDLANVHKQKLGKTMKECLVVYFCIQMLQIVQAMHQVHIIHADIKPDNFLVFITPENTVGLQLIDFGCSIDMSLFPRNASFRRRVTTEDFICCEMLDERPWNYHTDMFCIAATAHVLLFDTYIKLQKKENVWSIQQRFPRYLKVDLWNMFFSTLLNQQTGPADAASLILLFEETLETLNKDTISALPSQMRIIVNLLKNR